MKTQAVSVEDLIVYHRTTGRARFAAVALASFAIWSVSGRVPAPAPGSETCHEVAEATTVDYLEGAACPPAGFALTMGYEPVRVHTAYGWRYTKPASAGGTCSGPLSDTGPFWNFTYACRMHDYGYDLVRFGVGDRAEADGVLYRDMMLSCEEQGLVEARGCRSIANWAKAALRFGDAAGFDPAPADHVV